ncbi:MAG: hypothetical protein LBD82_08070 [Deltaproteobacteria bacterium]|jgi:hypothetical protein|nr:hypothetical protein [Deltaproteobacteria bacterium]
MANEGVLSRTKISGEKAATDDHPVIIHALPLDENVIKQLPPGLIMERTAAGAYRLYDPGNGLTCAVLDDAGAPTGDVIPAKPCLAVVNEPCDPETETSAKCVVHGCVKTRLLQTGEDPANAGALEALADCGIFAV